MRAVITVFVLAASSLAQAKPDFSGVFLRTETTVRSGHPSPAVPRLLDIKQTLDEVVVTASQNGETAVVHYRLDGKKSDKVQARLKGASLVLKTTVEWKGPLDGAPARTVMENLEEKWELSPDARQLTIRTTPSIGISEYESYIREPSLEKAKAAAELTAAMGCRKALPISELRNEKESTRVYDQGAVLGTALFEQITRCIGYEAVLSGDFFKSLRRTKKLEQVEFRRGGQTIFAYENDVVLEVSPLLIACSTDVGPWVQAGAPVEAVRELRFMVRWLGAQQKDLGEVESELLHEPWREQLAATDFYRMRIPANGIPLTDDLEVVIFAKDGKQLACVKGHI